MILYDVRRGEEWAQDRCGILFSVDFVPYEVDASGVARRCPTEKSLSGRKFLEAWHLASARDPEGLKRSVRNDLAREVSNFLMGVKAPVEKMEPSPASDFRAFVAWAKEAIRKDTQVPAAMMVEKSVADCATRGWLAELRDAADRRESEWFESIPPLPAADPSKMQEYERLRDEALAQDQTPPHPPGCDTPEKWAAACLEADRLLQERRAKVPCADCGGTGRYVGLNTEEPCRACGGKR